MKSYDIGVCRAGYGWGTFRVQADTEEEAREKALVKAGDTVFSEKDSDYFITDYQEMVIRNFNDPNYEELLKLVLTQKAALPMLLGLDEDLDALIDKALKE